MSEIKIKGWFTIIGRRHRPTFRFLFLEEIKNTKKIEFNGLLYQVFTKNNSLIIENILKFM